MTIKISLSVRESRKVRRQYANTRLKIKLLFSAKQPPVVNSMDDFARVV
jgi:hypothetical protein